MPSQLGERFIPFEALDTVAGQLYLDSADIKCRSDIPLGHGRYVEV
jgi:hypothetical protein